jgi:hypothetical protein
MEVLSKMSEVLTTITDEAQAAVIKKCEELGLDMNRGVVSLTETFFNLNQIKDILTDAIEKKKLNQLPLTIQKNLFTGLENVSLHISSALSGSDEVVNIVNAVEHLYTLLWQFNIHNISDEHLGYLKKMNQMKYQLTRVKTLEKELEEGIKLRGKLAKLLEEYEAKDKEVQSILATANSNATVIKETLDKNTEVSQKISAIATTIEQNDKTVKDLLASSKTGDSEIKALNTKIKEFADEIDEHSSKMTNITENANGTITVNKKETEALIIELKKLEGQIKDQIEKATGYSLFHSFQTRQESISGSKNKWLLIIAFLVAATVVLTAYLAYSHVDFNTAFYLKLSMSIPLIFAITFCTLQYSRERKLEEEYAFKSNISISLIPYKELVEKLSTTPEEKAKYTAFLIESINRVFTSPTERVFGAGDPEGPEASLKNLGKAIEAIVKPIEPILKITGKK